jgi:hypothetical protein
MARACGIAAISMGLASGKARAASVDCLLLRGRPSLVRRLGRRGDPVQPADRAEQVPLTVPALLMLRGEVRGTGHENEFQPAAERASKSRHAPDHHCSPASRRRAVARRLTADPRCVVSPERGAHPSHKSSPLSKPAPDCKRPPPHLVRDCFHDRPAKVTGAVALRCPEALRADRLPRQGGSASAISTVPSTRHSTPGAG